MRKRAVVFAACCAALAAGSAWAQQGGPGAARRGPSLEQRVAARVSILDERTGGLTPEQKAKAAEIYTAQLKAMDSARQDTSISPAQRREKMEEVNRKAEDAVSAILTDEQKAKQKEPKALKPEDAQVSGKDWDRLEATPK